MRIILLFITFLFFSSFSWSADSSNLNVIIISLTSLRADHLKTYGYRLNTAPNIDRFAKRSLVFENAITQSNWTLPAECSILTSHYVYSHGVYERNEKLSDQALTLPEILKIYGYKTAAFVGGLDMIKAHNLNQGFDCYDDDTNNEATGSFRDIIPKAISWLNENKNRKFFLFLQGYDVHPPFNKPGPFQHMYDTKYRGVLNDLLADYRNLKNIHGNAMNINGKTIKLAQEDIEHIIALYDGGITYADQFVGRLLSEIERLHLTGNSVIIITSEHGEELADHGSFDRFGRGNLYDEVIRVPLIIKYPGASSTGGRIKEQVQMIDVMPTVLEFLKIPINSEAQGISLTPLFRQGLVKYAQFAYSEANATKWAIRTNMWKLIYNDGKYELYDLANDPSEKKNLASRQSNRVYELMQKLTEWRKETRSGANLDNGKIEITDEMKQKLRAAGYW